MSLFTSYSSSDFPFVKEPKVSYLAIPTLSGLEKEQQYSENGRIASHILYNLEYITFLT